MSSDLDKPKMDENELKNTVNKAIEDLVGITEKNCNNANMEFAVDCKTKSFCDVVNTIPENTIPQEKSNPEETSIHDSEAIKGKTNVLQFKDIKNTDNFKGSDTEKIDEESFQHIIPTAAFSLSEHREREIEDSGTETDSDSSSIFSDTAAHEKNGNIEIKQNDEIIKTKGEVLPEDLPPIEKLQISIAADEKLLLLGRVSGVVGVLVIIQSSPDTPALNDDTVLFYQDRRIFGKVFEIFGPVTCPFYAVRFNSTEDIRAENIHVGIEVFCAPNVSEITQYIFLDQLKKLKGSDASWKDNNEPPEKHLDFSDDETERRYKAKKRGKAKDSETVTADNSGNEKNNGGKIEKGRTKNNEDRYVPVNKRYTNLDFVGHNSRYPVPRIPMQNFRPQNLFFNPFDNGMPAWHHPMNSQHNSFGRIDCDRSQHNSFNSNQRVTRPYLHSPYSQHFQNNANPVVMDTRFVQMEGNYKMGEI